MPEGDDSNGRSGGDRNDVDDDIRQARAGNRDALNRLIARSQARLSEMAHMRLGPGLRRRINTSDLLQSTYLDVVRDVDTFEGQTEDAFVGWVGRIIENNIRDKVRFFGAGKRKEPPTPNSADDDPWELPGSEGTPSAAATFGEELAIFGQAMASLSDDQRRAIQLRFVEGMNHRDAAKELGRTESATRVLISRARATLALEIERLREDSPRDDDRA